VDQEEVWSAIRYLDPDERTRLRMVRFNVSRSSSVVLTLAMSVSQAAEGEEAFTLVGSVK
jgi:hypothetical protein